jgi:hypothetical protein
LETRKGIASVNRAHDKAMGEIIGSITPISGKDEK